MKTSGPEELQIPKQGGYIQVFAETKKKFCRIIVSGRLPKEQQNVHKKGLSKC